MKIRTLLLVILSSTLSFSLQAQKKGEEKRPLDLEKFKKDQANFIQKELVLTDAQMKEFQPLFEEYVSKRYEANTVARDAARVLRQSETKTEAEYQRAIDAALDAKDKEAQLQREYYRKFGKVISAEKIYKYHRAEMKFMHQVVEKRRQERAAKKK